MNDEEDMSKLTKKQLKEEIHRKRVEISELGWWLHGGRLESRAWKVANIIFWVSLPVGFIAWLHYDLSRVVAFWFFNYWFGYAGFRAGYHWKDPLIVFGWLRKDERDELLRRQKNEARSS